MRVVSIVSKLRRLLASGPREQWIGLYIATLAVVLAIAHMGGSEVSTTAARSNVNAVNLWAWYQAKKGRKHQYELATLGLEIELERSKQLSPAFRARIARKIADFRSYIKTLETEPDKNEGLQELSVRAMEQTNIRNRAVRRSNYFDYAKAFLQIAIVFASMALIVSGNLAVVISVILAISSFICMINGYTLLLAFHPIVSILLLALPVLLLAGRENLRVGTLMNGQRRKLARRIVRPKDQSGMRQQPAE